MVMVMTEADIDYNYTHEACRTCWRKVSARRGTFLEEFRGCMVVVVSFYGVHLLRLDTCTIYV
jgi:hypothetical protein